MNVEVFDYALLRELIAERGIREREKARLLVLKPDRAIEHRRFFDIVHFIKPGDVVVLNNSKVFPARLFGNKKTGGRVDVLFVKKEESSENEEKWLILGKGRIKDGEDIFFPDGLKGKIKKEDGDLKIILSMNGRDFSNYLKRFGKMPLPPYIKREPDDEDNEYYQTVYAEVEGSLASPTAGLHFSKALIDELRLKGVEVLYVTLHISHHTFKLIKSGSLDNYKLEDEFGEVSSDVANKINICKKSGNRVFAVGTTTTRILETAGLDGEIKPFSGWTSLFIKPGFKFKAVDALITNFHLPKSSLFILVCSFAGIDNVKMAYEIAMKERYRFLSYGDAMLLFKD